MTSVTDLLEELRAGQWRRDQVRSLCERAADEIERLRRAAMLIADQEAEPMSDTRQKCSECNGAGTDPWGGTCLKCAGQGREPFREWGKEDDEDSCSPFADDETAP